jgi:flavin-dependent dehydrogenase
MALTLRQFYPALSVALIERSRFETPRIGEVLSPAAASLLDHLNVVGAFERERFHQVHGSAVSWGTPILADHPHLFAFHGPGWHLDRTRFDALLAREAARNGAELHQGVRASLIQRSAGQWHLHLSSGQVAHCRLLIDATGRAACIARQLGARPISADRLTGFMCLFSAAADDDPRTLIESAEHGWWYTAALDRDLRSAAFMTDADIGRDLQLSKLQNWQERLGETNHIARALRHAIQVRGPLVRSANSQHLEPVVTEDWMAVGDAALALDPLSGQGILASLRSGIFAAYAAGDVLTRGDGRALPRYQRFIQCALASFQRSRQRYYGEEQRWRSHPFWSRRAALDGLEQESLDSAYQSNSSA